MKKLLGLILCTVLFLTGCNGTSINSDKTTYNSYNNIFSVEVGKEWQQVEKGTLNSSADIELADLKNDKYFVALMENKADFEWTYDEYMDNTIKSNASTYDLEDYEEKDIKIGEYDCKYIEFKSTSETDVNTFIQIYYVETENYYGQLLTWTLNSKKDEYKDEFISLVQTFEEK